MAFVGIMDVIGPLIEPLDVKKVLKILDVATSYMVGLVVGMQDLGNAVFKIIETYFVKNIDLFVLDFFIDVVIAEERHGRIVISSIYVM